MIGEIRDDASLTVDEVANRVPGSERRIYPAETATEVPCWAPPTLPPPNNLGPCWLKRGDPADAGCAGKASTQSATAAPIR